MHGAGGGCICVWSDAVRAVHWAASLARPVHWRHHLRQAAHQCQRSPAHVCRRPTCPPGTILGSHVGHLVCFAHPQRRCITLYTVQRCFALFHAICSVFAHTQEALHHSVAMVCSASASLSVLCCSSLLRSVAFYVTQYNLSPVCRASVPQLQCMSA